MMRYASLKMDVPGDPSSAVFLALSLGEAHGRDGLPVSRIAYDSVTGVMEITGRRR